MKNTLWILLFLSLCSCSGEGLNKLFSRKAPLKLIEAEEPSVYLEDRAEFKSISDLNQSAMALNLLDKVVFTNQDFFLEKSHLLSRVDFLDEGSLQRDEEDIQLSFSSFCSPSLEKLNEEGEENRHSNQLFSLSNLSYVSIISLIPKALLFQKTDQNIYCSFIFKFKNKTYLLIQQEINTSRPSQSSYQVSLSNSDEKFHPVQESDVLKIEDLENIFIDTEIKDEINGYDLLCEGGYRLSFPSSERYAFKNLLESLPVEYANQNKTCVFYAVHNGNIRALSPRFQIDFSNFSPQKERLKFSELGRAGIRRGRGFFGKLEFRRFDEIKDIKDYDHIDVIVDSKCIDTGYFKPEVFTKTTRYSLGEAPPIVTFFPEELLFLLNINGVNLLFKSELIKAEYSKIFEEKKKKLHPFVTRLGSRIKSSAKWKLSNEMYEIELDESEDEEIARERRNLHNFECIYNVKLEDKIKMESQIVFENKYYEFKFKAKRNFKGYKMNYVKNTNSALGLVVGWRSLHQWIKDTLDMKNTDESNIKHRVYKGYVFDLDNIDSIDHGLGVFRINSLEEGGLDKMKFKCYAEKLKDGEWDYDREDLKSIEEVWPVLSTTGNQSISIKALLSDKDFRDKIYGTKEEDEKEDYLAICRLFLYSAEGQGDFLKYFSPEIKFIY